MKPVTDLNPTARRVMRLPETTRVIGLCDMTLRRLEAAGTFPRRFKLNPDGGLEEHDIPTVDDIAEAVAKDDYRFATLILEVTKSAPFRLRRGKTGANP